jgi:hypothetical protein
VIEPGDRRAGGERVAQQEPAAAADLQQPVVRPEGERV